MTEHAQISPSDCKNILVTQLSASNMAPWNSSQHCSHGDTSKIKIDPVTSPLITSSRAFRCPEDKAQLLIMANSTLLALTIPFSLHPLSAPPAPSVKPHITVNIVYICGNFIYSLIWLLHLCCFVRISSYSGRELLFIGMRASHCSGFFLLGHKL